MVTAKGFNLPYDKLLLSIGAALHFNNPEDKQSVEMLETISELGLAAAVSKFTGITSKDSLIGEIVDAYGRIQTLTK
jgi:mannitol-1-phosphate 5-dehydrogenase